MYKHSSKNSQKGGCEAKMWMFTKQLHFLFVLMNGHVQGPIMIEQQAE